MDDGRRCLLGEPVKLGERVSQRIVVHLKLGAVHGCLRDAPAESVGEHRGRPAGTPACAQLTLFDDVNHPDRPRGLIWDIARARTVPSATC